MSGRLRTIAILALLFGNPAFAETIEISGRVLDEGGQPVQILLP